MRMNRFFYLGTFLLSIVLISGFSNPAEIRQNEKSNAGLDKDKFLERHNLYRSQLGIPSLVWSDEIADYAQLWADRLAKTCDMQHRKTHQYGENIYWTSGTADEIMVVDRWAAEQKYFDHKVKTYIKGIGRKHGHYSQIIWAKSTHIGAAVANCKGGGQIWVCNYDPPGNYIGQQVY
jgi:pathogenesis-related protein 1